MDCISPLVPVAKSLMPPGKAHVSEYAWKAFLAKDSSNGTTIFNDSATMDVARHSLESCREWDSICQYPSRMFASPHNLAICSLYPEILTTENTVASEIQSTISTCLISYCALSPRCATDATTSCSVSGLITPDGYLSSQDVGYCWEVICDYFPTFVNSDIAGVGVSQSYSQLGHDLLTALAGNLILDADGNRIIGFCYFRYLPSVSYLLVKERLCSKCRPGLHKQGKSSPSCSNCRNTQR